LVPDKRGCKATFPLLIALSYFSCQTRPLEAAISTPGRKLNSTSFLAICRQSWVCRQLFFRLHWHLITCFPMLSYFYFEKKQGSGLGLSRYRSVPLNFSNQSQTLFKVLLPKTDVHSIHVGHRSVGCCKFFRFPFPSTMYRTMMTSNSCPARVCRKPINAELDSLMLAPVVVY
jgi:hypothetical protein